MGVNVLGGIYNNINPISKAKPQFKCIIQLYTDYDEVVVILKLEIFITGKSIGH